MTIADRPEPGHGGEWMGNIFQDGLEIAFRYFDGLIVQIMTETESERAARESKNQEHLKRLGL